MCCHHAIYNNMYILICILLFFSFLFQREIYITCINDEVYNTLRTELKLNNVTSCKWGAWPHFNILNDINIVYTYVGICVVVIAVYALHLLQCRHRREWRTEAILAKLDEFRQKCPESSAKMFWQKGDILNAWAIGIYSWTLAACRCRIDMINK